MARSKQGGAFGFLRGKVGSMSYSVISGKNTASGKTEQGVRPIPENVNNPQTVGQTMQRMKLAPAQKFYKAFSALLSNAFQGVAYGDASRRYFMSKCMTIDGPYVQRGVDRFLPAAYPFSEGSLPSVGIQPFSGGANAITLAVTTTEADVTPEVLAAALGISTDYQITVAVVNNVNGVFVPSFIPYDQRLLISALPAGTLAKDAENHITVDPAALGLDMSAMVACCIVISTQDATGAWLRSTQEMIISDELRAQLYSADALEAAIYSYQDGTSTVNAINSEWYYNLGMSQAWGGKLTTSILPVAQEDVPDQNVIIGLQQLDGRIKRFVFATSTEPDGLIMCVVDGKVTTVEGATVSEFQGLNVGYTVELWKDSYAAQLGLYSANSGGGDTPTPGYPTGILQKRSMTIDGETVNVLCQEGTGYVMVAQSSGAERNFLFEDTDNNRFETGGPATVTALGGDVVPFTSFDYDTGIIVYNGNRYLLNPPSEIFVYTPEPEP